MNEVAADVDVRVHLDREQPLAVARDTGHTRWHPDIPPIATIAPGDVVEADIRDGGDRQLTAAGRSGRSDINRLHPLTGPFFVTGAEPGDLLMLDLLAIEADDFGWTAVRVNGRGLMRDAVEEELVATWTIRAGIARSPQLPGIAIRGVPFLGIAGVAPSHERLASERRREDAVNQAAGWALLPGPEGAIPPEAGAEGLRTMPPRQIGGNLDIKDLAADASLTLPVEVPGALLSLGDPHFAQGDGESFGTAIEMAARVRFRCRLEKVSAIRWRPSFPVVQTTAQSRVRAPRAELITTGMSIDESGELHYMDVSLAVRRALSEMVDYLAQQRGFSRAQAQVIVSVAADLRVSVVNNPPTVVAAVALPLDVFESEPESTG